MVHYNYNYNSQFDGSTFCMLHLISLKVNFQQHSISVNSMKHHEDYAACSFPVKWPAALYCMLNTVQYVPPDVLQTLNVVLK